MFLYILRHNPPGMTTKRKNNAFSLIEAAIVLGIVGLVIGGLWAAATSVQRERKFQSLLTGMTTIVENMGKKVAGGVYSGPTTIQANGFTALGVDMGIAPADWVSGSNIFTPYGTDVSIYVNTDPYYLVMITLPKDACIRFLNSISKHPLYDSGSNSPSGSMWGRDLSGYPLSFRTSSCIDGNNNISSNFLYTH